MKNLIKKIRLPFLVMTVCFISASFSTKSFYVINTCDGLPNPDNPQPFACIYVSGESGSNQYACLNSVFEPMNTGYTAGIYNYYKNGALQASNYKTNDTHWSDGYCFGDVNSGDQLSLEVVTSGGSFWTSATVPY